MIEGRQTNIVRHRGTEPGKGEKQKGTKNAVISRKRNF